MIKEHECKQYKGIISDVEVLNNQIRCRACGETLNENQVDKSILIKLRDRQNGFYKTN